MTHPVVERILAGDVPANVKLAAARGALPIPREELIELWVQLRADEDGEVRLACKESLAGVAEAEWLDLLPDHPFSAPVLDFAVRVLGRNAKVLDAALRNRGVPTESLEWLAQQGTGEALDRVLDNQIRLLEAPTIVVAMLANPGLNPTQVRRIFDMAEQFFRDHPEIPSLLELRFGLKVGMAGGDFARKKEAQAPAPVEGPPEAEVPPPEIPEILESKAETLGVADIPEYAFQDEPLTTEKFRNLYQQILVMSVPAKIELALKGNKEARGLLIRDSNKVVQEAVLDSPKLTEVEIESIVRMRILSEDLFRKIERNMEWMKRYSIMKAFMTNPKVPPGLTLKYVARLADQDLRLLTKDRNVTEVLRREAKKMYDLRHAQKGPSFKK
ncbi:MAG: hypothetical protein ACOYXN_02250 [Acidobacteriota bacterium]